MEGVGAARISGQPEHTRCASEFMHPGNFDLPFAFLLLLRFAHSPVGLHWKLAAIEKIRLGISCHFILFPLVPCIRSQAIKELVTVYNGIVVRNIENDFACAVIKEKALPFRSLCPGRCVASMCTHRSGYICAMLKSNHGVLAFRRSR